MPSLTPEPVGRGVLRDGRLLLLVVVGLALNTTGLSWGLPPSEYFAWDVDGVVPMQPLEAAKRMFVDDWWNSGYYNKFPAGHLFVLMAAYAPYLAYLWLTGRFRDPGEVYPYGFTDPETALTALSLIARGIAALMGVGIVILVYLAVRRLAGARAGFFAGLTIALSPTFIFYAHTGNVDTPSVFWSALGLLAFARLAAGDCGHRHYVLLGAAVGMAAATKEQTLGLFYLLPFTIVVLHAGHLKGPAPGRRRYLAAAVDRAPLAGLAASIVTFVVATHLVFNWHGNLLRLRWRILRLHPTEGTYYPRSAAFEGPLEGLGQFAQTTWGVMNPILFLVAVVALLVLPLRYRWGLYFLVPLVSYAALAVAMFDSFRARFVMEAVLVLAFFAGPVLAWLWTEASRRGGAWAVPLVGVWLYSFAYGAETTYLLARDARYDAEAWLAHAVPAGTRIEAFSGPVYLPRFPNDLQVHEHVDLTAADLPERLAGLRERRPDLLVLSSAFSRRFHRDPAAADAYGRLLAGEYGYRPVQVFRREPVLSPRLIPGLSPEITILGNGRLAGMR